MGKDRKKQVQKLLKDPDMKRFPELIDIFACDESISLELLMQARATGMLFFSPEERTRECWLWVIVKVGGDLGLEKEVEVSRRNWKALLLSKKPTESEKLDAERIDKEINQRGNPKNLTKEVNNTHYQGPDTSYTGE